MKDNKINISFLTLESYTRPEITENKRHNFVQYGADNNFYQELIDLYSDSATNNAIINSAAQMIYGDGLEAINEDSDPVGWAQFENMILPKDLRKVVIDFKMLGMCAFQLTYTPDRKKVAKMEHFPVNTLRAEIANENGDVEAYYYCYDWSSYKRASDLTRLPAFGFGKGKDTEIMFIKTYVPGSFYYSQVDYHGCLPYCKLEAELANYHISNVLNGFMPSALINFNNGEPETQEIKFEIERKIQEKFTGTSNAGKFVLSFNDNKENAAEIIPINLADAHSQYEYVSNEAQNKIITSHRVTSPIILGIKDANGFSSNAEEIMVAASHYEKTVLEPFRRMIIDAIYEVQEINGTNFDLYFVSLYRPKDSADIIEEVKPEI